MTKQELAALRRIAERKFNEESDRRIRAAQKVAEADEKKLQQDKDFKQYKKIATELDKFGSKLRERRIGIEISGGRWHHYHDPSSAKPYFLDQHPEKTAVQKWQTETRRTIEDLFDETEIKSAGIEASTLLEKLNELLRSA